MTRLRHWPAHLRWFAASFVFVTLVGYGAGLVFMVYNTGADANGIADHYHGNEDTMEFGKSAAEMLEIVHTHLLGMSVLFLGVGVFFAFTDFPRKWKGRIMVETMLTLLSTFGGLWFVAAGWRAAVWVIYPSSILMIGGYLLMSGVTIWNCLTPQRGRERLLSRITEASVCRQTRWTAQAGS